MPSCSLSSRLSGAAECCQSGSRARGARDRGALREEAARGGAGEGRQRGRAHWRSRRHAACTGVHALLVSSDYASPPLLLLLLLSLCLNSLLPRTHGHGACRGHPLLPGGSRMLPAVLKHPSASALRALRPAARCGRHEGSTHASRAAATRGACGRRLAGNSAGSQASPRRVARPRRPCAARRTAPQHVQVPQNMWTRMKEVRRARTAWLWRESQERATWPRHPGGAAHASALPPGALQAAARPQILSSAPVAPEADSRQNVGLG